MSAHRVAPLLALLLTVFAEPASAFLDPPYITPANPSVGDPISVNIYGGQCDLVHDGVFPPVVTQHGNAITILFTGIHEDDPEWCYYGVGTATYLVGTYPAGSYTLQADRQYFNFAAVLVRETLGVIPFTVTGVSQPVPVSAPALNIVGFSVLLLALASIAAWRVDSRARADVANANSALTLQPGSYLASGGVALQIPHLHDKPVTESRYARAMWIRPRLRPQSA